MRSDITPGQTSDYPGLDLVMDNNPPEPRILLADRGHDADRVRKTMEDRDVVPVIPMQKSRKLRVAIDRKPYRLRHRMMQIRRGFCQFSVIFWYDRGVWLTWAPVFRPAFRGFVMQLP